MNKWAEDETYHANPKSLQPPRLPETLIFIFRYKNAFFYLYIGSLGLGTLLVASIASFYYIFFSFFYLIFLTLPAHRLTGSWYIAGSKPTSQTSKLTVASPRIVVQ